MIRDDLLAELIGIILGDGSINVYPDINHYRLKISFNSETDLAYMQYVEKMISELFGVVPSKNFRKNENTAELLIFNRKVIRFLISLGMKTSPKRDRVTIPSLFLENSKIVPVIRGLFDTDGCLLITNNNGSIYPRLEIKILESPLQNQVHSILTSLNFNIKKYTIGNGNCRLQINGKKQLLLWKEIIGFSNPKHLEKYYALCDSNNIYK